jgi:hypothetical protein
MELVAFGCFLCFGVCCGAFVVQTLLSLPQGFFKIITPLHKRLHRSNAVGFRKTKNQVEFCK